MRDQSLRGHVGNLEQQGEMTRFDTEVDPHENLSALGWKTYDQLGKSSLFTNLKGFPGWTVCNQIVTDRKKWSIAIGVDESELIPTLVDRIAAHSMYDIELLLGHGLLHRALCVTAYHARMRQVILSRLTSIG